MTESRPYFSAFSPDFIPYQREVVDLIRDFDYSQGNLEILLSGSYGCLREDALVQTIYGEVPICDINQSSQVLSFHENSNQFCFAPSSGAFPKGKDYLYRVIGEHGEFVASGHHLLATSPYTYSKICDLVGISHHLKVHAVQLNAHHAASQKLFAANVLRYWETVASFLGHCVERIHRYGLQLPQELNDDLLFLHKLSDAQEFGLFFCSRRPERAGAFQALGKVRDRIAELLAHQPMPDFCHRVVAFLEVAVGVCIQVDSKSYEHIFLKRLQSLLFHTHSDRPQDLLSFLSFLLPALVDSLSFEVGVTESSICKIERLEKQEWYWDFKVPNTHNYIANGYQHHNSAKSLLMAHVAIRHCIENKGARVAICRRALPDLKRTIWREILDHMQEDFIEGVHYRVNRSALVITFKNGSEIISCSWADKLYAKFRSLKISMLLIEEIVENSDDDEEAFKQLRARLRRIPGMKPNIVIAATNPDAPSHWVYKYWIASEFPNRKVFYSRTEDNPFIDRAYVRQLRQDLSPKEALRYLEGQWIELMGEVIYYEYDSAIQFKKNEEYKINPHYPVILSFDFNIAEGKPMSAIQAQYIDDKFHFFNPSVIHGARTADIFDDWSELLDTKYLYILTGDAAGRHRDTRSSRSDYDIAVQELKNRGLNFEYKVPLSNPAIRSRHNRVNAYCKNANGDVRMFLYKGCEKADEAMRLTKLRKGANYLEDDSKDYQHIGTAMGYCIMTMTSFKDRGRQGTTIL